MSNRSNIDNAGASQVAATDPVVDVFGTEGLGTVPVVPGVGPEVAQSSSGGVMPDLTLLKFEELLNLDPTDDSGPAGRSLETEPLHASPSDGELPADLTSLDLDQLLELGLSGANLPTLLEVAGLSGENQGDEGGEHGPPEGAEPPIIPLLEDENDDDGEPGPEDDSGFEVSFNNDSPPPDAAAGNPPAGDPPGDSGQGNGASSQNNSGPAGSESGSENAPANNGQDNGPDSNSGQGNDAGVEIASNNNAGGNSANVNGGSANSNAGGGPGANAGGGANRNAGSTPGNVGGGSANGNAGGNPGSGAGAIAVAAAGISVPGGGGLPASITPADVAAAVDLSQAVPTTPPAPVPTGPPAMVPPANSVTTYVPSSDSNNGPGNSSFGHSNGAATGNTSALDNASSLNVPAPIEELPSNVVTPDAGSSNDSAASPTGVSLTGSGGSDSLAGGDYADDLSGLGGSDTLQGGAGNDTLSGGGGGDFLDGGAGADNLSGGGGDDVLVWDFDNINIDGGGGDDTLRVDSGDADIASFGGTITGIENVDLATDAGANTLTLTTQDVLDMSGTDTLTVSGDALDSLDAGTGWTDGGVSGGNHIYTQAIGPDTATLVVDTDVTVNANILV